MRPTSDEGRDAVIDDDKAFHDEVLTDDSAFQRELRRQIREENPELALALGFDREEQ